MRAGWLAGLLLGAAACTHLTPFTPRALAGQTVSLRPGWSMVLAIDGAVGGRAAVVRLAVEEPLSRVTAGCFETPPEVVARVDTHLLATGGGVDAGTAAASSRSQEAVIAPQVRLGDRTLGDVQALSDPGADCTLTLGSEVLLAFVLEVNPGARTVTFHPQFPPTPPFRSEESVVLDLTRDPTTDRASLAVQLETRGAPLTVPMVLGTATGAVEVSSAVGRALAGADAGGRVLALSALAFAPDWVLRHVDAVVDGAPGQGPAPDGAEPLPQSPSVTDPRPVRPGLLGAQSWGHYRVLIDLRGQHLVLYRRPPPVEGQAGPQSWTHLSSDSTATGSRVRLITWEMLPAGGVVPLEPSRARLRSCRVGLTLAPEDPGATLEVTVPWPGLERELPGCAKELAAVPAWSGELDPSGPKPCTGTCIYAQEVESGRTVCSCADRRAPDVLAPARAGPPGKTAPEEPEPEDPATTRKPPPKQH